MLESIWYWQFIVNIFPEWINQRSVDDVAIPRCVCVCVCVCVSVYINYELKRRGASNTHTHTYTLVLVVDWDADRRLGCGAGRYAICWASLVPYAIYSLFTGINGLNHRCWVDGVKSVNSALIPTKMIDQVLESGSIFPSPNSDKNSDWSRVSITRHNWINQSFQRFLRTSNQWMQNTGSNSRLNWRIYLAQIRASAICVWRGRCALAEPTARGQGGAGPHRQCLTWLASGCHYTVAYYGTFPRSSSRFPILLKLLKLLKLLLLLLACCWIPYTQLAESTG